MTVSGVVAVFRKKALLDSGLWDRDLITEDIGITWKLQRRFWDIRYEPRALCWILVPETLSGFWKQRIRWAQGGLEVLIRHWKIIFSWKNRRLIPILIEQLASVVWAISWLMVTLWMLYKWALTGNLNLIHWQGQYLLMLCLFQFLIAMRLDQNYDEKLLRYYAWAIWYPTFYWYFNALIVVRAIPKAFKSSRNHDFAIWESPDRGLSNNTLTKRSITKIEQKYNRYKKES
jgi:biofilm PGA synthesis N-glycosyltransferase PgaC